MGRCKIKKYAFGANAIGNWGDLKAEEKASAISGAGSSLASFAGNALGKQDVTIGNTLSSTISGISSGAALGGPVGAIVGGALGLGTSLVGRSGSVDQTTGEIDYGSGFGKWFGRSKNSLQQESGRIKSGAIARQQAENIAADYYMDHGYNGISFAADGGILPNTLAYLDDGEFIRTPDGDISEVPEENKPTDSNLANVPVGTQVLSDKWKVPGTNKTFAQMYKKITNRRKSTGNDMYARNSDKLNDLNEQIVYQQLLEQQEALRAEKETNSYAGGTDGITPYGYNKDITKFKYWDSKANDYMQSYKDFVNNLTEQDVNDIFSGKYGDMSTYLSKNKGIIPTVAQAKALMLDKKYGDWHKMSEKFADTKMMSNVEPTFVSRNIDVPLVNVNREGAYGTGRHFYIAKPDKLNAYYGDFSMDFPTEGKKRNRLNLGDLAADFAALAGPFANISASEPEAVDTYTYDPQYGPTEYNIDPLLRQAALTDSISRYNMANINPNTGANMAYGLQSAQARNNAVANAYYQKASVENPLAFQNAQIANAWGQQYANARHLAATEQAENMAAARNIRNQGIADLSTRIQQISRDKKLARRDQGLYEAMQEFLSHGQTAENIEKLNRYFR